MLDLGRPDAVCERAEGAVRRSVAVAANDRRAGKRKALLRPDDVNDALALIELVEIFDAEILGVLRERLDLRFRLGILDALRAVGGGDVVVDDRERLFRRAHLAAGHAQSFEGLRARHLVHEMTVDIEKASPVRLRIDDVIVPDFVVERACSHCVLIPISRPSFLSPVCFRALSFRRRAPSLPPLPRRERLRPA